ncbi:MAG: fatty acid desaturase [Betaproteobacteria bacterium]|nr:MAG: fatty acid desaturase [Betaproteobacteria bacterium]
MRASLAIPGTLNIALAATAAAAACALLWAASHTDSWSIRVLAAIGFSFVANTIFSLLHEAVHRHFHPDMRINEAFGILCAAFFPTGLTFQRVVHFGHHRRNRTDWELFDHYQPGVSRFRTLFRLYCLLTGFFWMSAPLGCALYLAAGPFFRSRVFQQVICRWYGFEPMVADLAAVPGSRMRLEIVFTAAFQAALVLLLDLSLLGWCLCYGVFALNWCSLQYTDHAWTRRDIVEGASNLRVNRLVQWIFLNYHHHLAHHQHPEVPWIHLARFVDFDKPRPSFLRTYLSLWLGPRPTDEPPPHPLDARLERWLRV